MELERLVAALAPEAVLGSPDPVEVRDLAYDTRAVTPGAAFFCVPGEHADGHDFAGEAVERGAVVLVVERAVEPEVPAARRAVVARRDGDRGGRLLRRADARARGRRRHRHERQDDDGVPAARDPDRRRPSPGLLGTVESRIGGEVRPVVRTTPEAIDLQRTFREMLDAGDRSVALEASSHAAVLHRLDRVRFDALVFTNLTQDHLDFHGTMEDYYVAKRRLFTGAAPPPAAVNIGDAWGRQLADELEKTRRAPLITFGFADDAEIRPEELVLDGSGARFRAGGIALETLAARPLQRRERARRGRRGDPARRGRGRDRRRRAGARRRARPVRGRRRGAALHGARRLRAHARLARQRAPDGARAHGRAACSSSSARAATATAASGR